MYHSGQRARALRKSDDCIGFAGHAGVKNLDRDIAACALAARGVQNAHAGLSQFVENAIISEHRVDHSVQR